MQFYRAPTWKCPLPLLQYTCFSLQLNHEFNISTRMAGHAFLIKWFRYNRALILLTSPSDVPNHQQFHYSLKENETLHSRFINFWKEALMWGRSIRRMNMTSIHVIIRPKPLKMIFWSPFQAIYSNRLPWKL